MSNEQISETLEDALRVLNEWPEPIAARGVEFWMEMVTVAASARVLSDEEEPPLQYEDLRLNLETWSVFMNFWNDPP